MLADDAAIVCYLTAGPTFLFLDGINLAPCSICHHRAFHHQVSRGISCQGFR